MAINVKYITSSAVEGDTGITINGAFNSSTATGDLLLAFITKDDDTATTANPTGWTLEQGFESNNAIYTEIWSKEVVSADEGLTVDPAVGQYCADLTAQPSEGTIGREARFGDSGKKIYYCYSNIYNSFVWIQSLDIPYKIDSGYTLLSTVTFNLSDNVKIRSCRIYENGTKIYFSGESNNKIYEYNLLEAWDLSTLQDTGNTLTTHETYVNGFDFSSDGTYFYALGSGTRNVKRWALSTAWDLSTATASGSTYTMSIQDAWGLDFVNDGLAFLSSSDTFGIRRYVLNSAWDLSSVTQTGTYLFSSESLIDTFVSYSTVDLESGKFLGKTGSNLFTIDLNDTQYTWTGDSESYTGVLFLLEDLRDIDISSVSTSIGTADPPISPTVTTGNYEAIVFAGYGADNNTASASLDSSLTGVNRIGAGTGAGTCYMGVGYEVLPSSTASGTYTHSIVIDEQWTAWTLYVSFTHKYLSLNQLVESDISYDFWWTKPLMSGMGHEIDVAQYVHRGYFLDLLLSTENDYSFDILSVTKKEPTVAKFNDNFAVGTEISCVMHDITAGDLLIAIQSNDGDDATIDYYPAGWDILDVFNNNNIVSGTVIGKLARHYSEAYDSTFDVRGITRYTGNSNTTPTTQISTPLGIRWNDDGTKIFICESDSATPNIGVNEYSVTTAYDISSTITFTTFYAISTYTLDGCLDVIFNSDGTKMFVLSYDSQNSRDIVKEYTLSTGFDLTSTVTHQTDLNVTTSTPLRVARSKALYFKPDGSVLFVSSHNSTGVETIVGSWDLSTNYLLSSATYDTVSSVLYNTTPANPPTSMAFNGNGTFLFLMTIGTSDVIEQYTLSTAWDIGSTITHVKSASITGGNSTGGRQCFTFTGTGDKFIVADSTAGLEEYYTNIEQVEEFEHFNLVNDEYFSGTNLQATTRCMMVKPDGTKAYTFGITTGNVLFELDLEVPYDINTAVYNSVSYTFSTEITGSIEQGIFSPDGDKLFVTDVNVSSTLREYSLSTDWDISTISYDNRSRSNTREIFIPKDGLTIYYRISPNIETLELSSAWTLAGTPTSGSSYDYVTAGLKIRYFGFSDDGFEIYIYYSVDNAIDAVEAYKLNTAYDATSFISNTHSLLYVADANNGSYVFGTSSQVESFWLDSSMGMMIPTGTESGALGGLHAPVYFRGQKYTWEGASEEYTVTILHVKNGNFANIQDGISVTGTDSAPYTTATTYDPETLLITGFATDGDNTPLALDADLDTITSVQSSTASGSVGHIVGSLFSKTGSYAQYDHTMNTAGEWATFQVAIPTSGVTVKRAVGLSDEDNTAFDVEEQVTAQPIGLTTETDSGFNNVPIKIITLLQALENDSGLALDFSTIISMLLVTENDSSFNTIWSKIKEIGLVTESDLSLTLNISKLKAITQLVENNSAFSVLSSKLKEILLSTSDESAFLLSPLRIISLSQIIENDISQIIGSAKYLLFGLSTENDVAFTNTFFKEQSISLAEETDVGQWISTSSAILIYQSIEEDISLGIDPERLTLINQPTVTDSGLSFSSFKLKEVDLSEETNISNLINPDKSITTLLNSEIDLSFELNATKAKAISLASVDEQAFLFKLNKIKEINISSELNASLSMTPLVDKLIDIGLTSETDIANTLGKLKDAVIGLSAENDNSFDISLIVSGQLGLATENNYAQIFDSAKLLAILLASDSEYAQIIDVNLSSTLGIGTENDLSFDYSSSKAKFIGLSEETDESNRFFRPVTIEIGLAEEIDESFLTLYYIDLPYDNIRFEVLLTQSIHPAVVIKTSLNNEVTITQKINKDVQIKSSAKEEVTVTRKLFNKAEL